jgi:hypothetical protein
VSFRPTSLLSQSAVHNVQDASYPSNAVTIKSTKLPSNETSKPFFFTELAWEESPDGIFFAVLEFCSNGNDTFAYGPFRNCKPGQPAPLIRMKPKRHYHLTLVNNAHIDTNLHTHGLHVSGVGKKREITFCPATSAMIKIKRSVFVLFRECRRCYAQCQTWILPRIQCESEKG